MAEILLVDLSFGAPHRLTAAAPYFSTTVRR
jgi:hypothetical protein